MGSRWLWVALLRNTVIELAAGQREVVTPLLEQLLMAAALDNDPVSDHGYDVGIPDGGEPVGDDDGGSICHGVVESLLNHLRNKKNQ